MKSIAAYFDIRCRKQSLNKAIFLLFAFSWCLAISYWMIVKYSSNGDRGGFYLGIAFAIICTLGLFVSSQSIHAIVRRMVAEARKES